MFTIMTEVNSRCKGVFGQELRAAVLEKLVASWVLGGGRRHTAAVEVERPKSAQRRAALTFKSRFVSPSKPSSYSHQ